MKIRIHDPEIALDTTIDLNIDIHGDAAQITQEAINALLKVKPDFEMFIDQHYIERDVTTACNFSPVREIRWNISGAALPITFTFGDNR